MQQREKRNRVPKHAPLVREVIYPGQRARPITRARSIARTARLSKADSWPSTSIDRNFVSKVGGVQTRLLTVNPLDLAGRLIPAGLDAGVHEWLDFGLAIGVETTQVRRSRLSI